MPDNQKAIGKRKTSNPSNLPKGINYLLTIGIDDYLHCPKLNNAVRDTRDIANVLLEKYEFEATHHLKLENKEATLDNIIALFREIKNKATEKDNVLIYYSGHGKLNEDEESFWIPVDARENKEGDFISVDKLFRLIKVIKSHHILLILDSCFSGSMLSANTSRSLNKNEIQPSRYGIASGRRELVSDGKPGANSPFADAVIKKLRVNSESLGASDLAQEVMHLTKNATNQNQVPLHGRMRITGDKLGEFFFHPKEENKEESLWGIIVIKNTIHAYDDYLEKFPNGKYADEAEQRMEDLEHEETWQKTKRNNSIVSYRKYLRRYSKGKYRADAQAAIQKIKSGEEEKVDELIEEVVPVKTKVTKPTAQPTDTTNTFTDPRDGQTYKIAKLKDGNIWMTQNFNFDTGKNCWHFDNISKNGNEHGRLYTWDAAQKACPEGWHIPSDDEWWNLANHYDMPFNVDESKPRNENSNAGSEAYKALTKGGSSPLEILLSGLKMIDGDFAGLGKFGNYWSSTNSFDVHFFYYNFGGNQMRRGVLPKRIANSCRYIKNVDGEKSLVKKTSKIIQPTPHIIKDPNLFTDPRDGQIYKTVKLKDGNIWMAQNLNYNVDRRTLGARLSRYYNDNPEYGEKYGRLYNWSGAMKACPDGWHLPSDEEWSNMIKHYGGHFYDSEDKGRSAYEILIEGGTSNFSAMLGGYRNSDGLFHSFGEYGYYWGSNAWCYRFYESHSRLYRGNQNNIKSWGLSCRCIQD